MIARRSLLWLSLLLALLTSACAPHMGESVWPEVYDQPLTYANTLEQSFTAKYAGLSGVRVWVRGEPDEQIQLRMALYEHDNQQDPLLTANSVISADPDGESVQFSFPVLPDSSRKSYQIQLSVSGKDTLTVGSAHADAYLNGALSSNRTPLERQMAFGLLYDPAMLAGGLAGEMLTWLGWLLLAWLAFGGAGWGLAMLIWPRLPGIHQLLLGLSLGLGLPPLFLLLLNMPGLRLNPAWSWLTLGLGAGFGLGVFLIRWRRTKKPVPVDWPLALGLVLLIAAVLVTRWWSFRMAAAPSWGDSVQHATMAQLIVDNGGLFNSWRPYAPYVTLTQQYGFSGLTAIWCWLSGQEVLGGMVLFGQLLNVMAVVVWLPLAWRLSGRNRLAAFAAIAVMGLVTRTPGNYSDWGRYAQLAGQCALPAALWLAWDLLEGERPLWPKAVLLAAVNAGMLLCYYRNLFTMLTFLLPLFLLLWLQNRGERRRLLRGAGFLGLAGGVSFLFLLPWVIRVSGSVLAGGIETGVLMGTQWQVIQNDYRAWLLELYIYPNWLLALGAGVFILSLTLRRWRVALVGVWFLLFAGVRASSILRIPGANMVQSSAVIFALYIPLGLLLGWLIAEIWGRIWKNRYALIRGLGLLAFGIILAGFFGWGFRQQMYIAKPIPYTLVTWPDRNAAQWIRANTPPDSVFLVEGLLTHAGMWAVGSDAGWWLPLIAGRANTMPPQYALVNEPPEDPGYSRRIVDLVTQLTENSPAAEKSLRMLCEAGVTHVYIGQQRGRANIHQLVLYQESSLQNSWAFERVYAADRVRVYRLRESACRAR